jgi:polyhydroxybutyrate depolymerase
MLSLTLALALVCADPLTPGNHTHSLEWDGRARTYQVHVPPQYDPNVPTPVVLAFHGAMMNGGLMAGFTGLSKKADEAGFVVVYPYGTGSANRVLFWNAGGMRDKAEAKVDDVGFVRKILDDLPTVINVDPRRVYATGMSNGAMLCYRLACELSDRIAAIAPVSGTLMIEQPKPSRPVPVIHFHGTEDRLVPYAGSAEPSERYKTFKTVDETMQIWAKIDGCPEEPEFVNLPDTVDDDTTVSQKIWGPGKDGAEVILYTITGGGHTWPGKSRGFGFLGKATQDISANDLIWEFFEKHPMPEKAALESVKSAKPAPVKFGNELPPRDRK